MHPFAMDADGSMFIDVASATNSCHLKNRALKSPGAQPCKELETHGGIWRYDANKSGQAFSPAGRFATGIRNAHGRDQLRTNWPQLYKPDDEVTLPAEELLLLKQSGDYGWPERGNR